MKKPVKQKNKPSGLRGQLFVSDFFVATAVITAVIGFALFSVQIPAQKLSNYAQMQSNIADAVMEKLYSGTDELSDVVSLSQLNLGDKVCAEARKDGSNYVVGTECDAAGLYPDGCTGKPVFVAQKFGECTSTRTKASLNDETISGSFSNGDVCVLEVRACE